MQGLCGRELRLLQDAAAAVAATRASLLGIILVRPTPGSPEGCFSVWGMPASWAFVPHTHRPDGHAGAQERRASLAAGAAARADLLGVLLDARDEDGQPMTDEELWEVRCAL